jgi:hypothetical protein
LAYANMITTVFSRTVTGMVPNYRNGKGGTSCTFDRTEPMVGTWSLEILWVNCSDRHSFMHAHVWVCGCVIGRFRGCGSAQNWPVRMHARVLAVYGTSCLSEHRRCALVLLPNEQHQGVRMRIYGYTLDISSHLIHTPYNSSLCLL